ncbi:basic form of pathogenesis-related protein 1-like [Chenopodium quinoa]|uniref:SCP domain-containing protein n=1 Tax=Chenopodium quinoa TaxID=63459 RepID=A0A803MC44_CHEQI|nr:basic form of pathogenesis-related protein 1-like [Chenopodium quinoa]
MCKSLSKSSTLTTFSCLIIATVAFVQICHAQNSPQDYLDAHNAARAEVGVVNIEWDSTLASYARRYALSRVDDCALLRSNGPYGENLAVSSNPLFTGTDAVELWLQQKVDYDYSSNTCAIGADCLTYTQLVWHDSVNVGCARVQCVNGWIFVMCSYNPPGNIIGQRPF